jgi:pimeloyl-ACP methyl ester carboxylesterase
MTITNRIFRQPLLRSLCFVVFVGALALSVSITTGAAAAANTSSQTGPTIVLVHGAWADSSSWTGVVKRLQRDGFTVLAPANPLRSLQSDSAYISSFLNNSELLPALSTFLGPYRGAPAAVLATS